MTMVAYMGDDLVDLPVLAPGRALGRAGRRRRRGARRVHWVSPAGGGRGAVRELIEMVLRAQQRWDDVRAPLSVAGLMSP